MSERPVIPGMAPTNEVPRSSGLPPDTLDPDLSGTARGLTRPGLPRALRAGPAEPVDFRWMARALERAREAREAGEVPVGAVLIRDQAILAEGFNRTRSRPDPTAHAEVEAIRAAARTVSDWRLLRTTLYVTLEPCAQCAGAILLARVPRLVYAAPDPKGGMVGSLGNLLQDRRLNHRVAVTTGVLADEAGRLLREFFRERR